MIKINRTILIQWRDLLRSGTYAQGRHCLRTSDNRYCCLGVLTELVLGPKYWESAPPGIEMPPGAVTDRIVRNTEGVMSSSVILNGKMLSRLFNEPMTFTTMNDKMGYSFEDIAVIIDECLARFPLDPEDPEWMLIQ